MPLNIDFNAHPTLAGGTVDKAETSIGLAVCDDRLGR